MTEPSTSQDVVLHAQAQRMLRVTAQDWGLQLPSPQAIARRAVRGYVPLRVRRRRQREALAWTVACTWAW